MYDYGVYSDIEIICQLLGMNYEQLAGELGVSAVTAYRWKSRESSVSLSNVEAIYSFAYKKNIHLNTIKAQLLKEELEDDHHKVVFHGAKRGIDGSLSLDKAKLSNDFGRGFYCGESLEQSAMFVADYPESSLYILEFDDKGLEPVKYNVDRDWMLTIAWFRGRLKAYADSPVIKKLAERAAEADYIIAPIADNRMFEIIDSFIDGEITDVQCIHCLSATDLGRQYVFTSKKALDKVKIVRRCYLCKDEKRRYQLSQRASADIGNDKVKVARKKYRGQGEYIEDLL